jgi:hypothetical protein
VSCQSSLHLDTSLRPHAAPTNLLGANGAHEFPGHVTRRNAGSVYCTWVPPTRTFPDTSTEWAVEETRGDGSGAVPANGSHGMTPRRGCTPVGHSRPRARPRSAQNFRDQPHPPTTLAAASSGAPVSQVQVGTSRHPGRSPWPSRMGRRAVRDDTDRDGGLLCRHVEVAGRAHRC